MPHFVIAEFAGLCLRISLAIWSRLASINLSKSSPLASNLSIMDAGSYLRAHFKWRRSGLITIVTTYDTEIGTFPMSFLESCGDNSWQYILFVVSQLVDIRSDGPGTLVSEQGQEVDMQSAPAEGVYRYLLTGV